jgi:N utilization substance protein A
MVGGDGTLIGGHGVRVKAVNAEIGETERLDIVEWVEDPKDYIIRAMSPAQIEKVEIDEEEKRAQVWVSEEQVRIAIGRGGANVRLAGELVGYEIDVIKPEMAEEDIPSVPTKPETTPAESAEQDS